MIAVGHPVAAVPALPALPPVVQPAGFSHRYRALGKDELLFVLNRHWRRLGRELDPEDFTDAQAIAAIERLTRGKSLGVVGFGGWALG